MPGYDRDDGFDPDLLPDYSIGNLACLPAPMLRAVEADRVRWKDAEDTFMNGKARDMLADTRDIDTQIDFRNRLERIRTRRRAQRLQSQRRR